jgi:hypothetical protein
VTIELKHADCLEYLKTIETSQLILWWLTRLTLRLSRMLGITSGLPKQEYLELV